MQTANRVHDAKCVVVDNKDPSKHESIPEDNPTAADYEKNLAVTKKIIEGNFSYFDISFTSFSRLYCNCQTTVDTYAKCFVNWIRRRTTANGSKSGENDSNNCTSTAPLK
jgi:hypothetical protein